MRIERRRRLVLHLAWLPLLMQGSLARADPVGPWFDGERPGPQARQAVSLLLDASSHGLRPDDYAAAALQQAVERAALGAPPDADSARRLDLGLTLAMQRYLGDLHGGRVDPRALRIDFEPADRAAFDAASVLRDALRSGRVGELPREVAPRLPLYEQLRGELARYRALAADAAWRTPLPPLPGAPGRAARLEPGQPYAGTALLAQRLVALGDLPAATPLPALYEGPLVAALQSFQARHGLASDGVVGAATLAQLQVTPAARARQIELMLERLRWTPLTQRPRMIVVNIPEFVLRAYEVRDGRIAVQREMKVIVGKAYDTRTPLLDEDMRSIEFSPYWNVPPSIARGEIVPKLRRDPGYFAREGFEFVAADGRVQTELSAQALDAVLAGAARIRQRPGERNALGDIKFVFPNRDHIYLHHTPATQLFERARRDFSHGCIRVEQPVALATFVLQDQPSWTEARIRQAMSQGTSTTLRLATPVPVLIAYGTALVKGGRTYFFDDIYGLDRELEAALRQRPPPAWTIR
jgi:murein L,D-transpeptidase YcbB/YkuD